MNIIPIVFAFDNNLILPACVTISSLLLNAKDDTFYDIFILHSETENLKKDDLDKIPFFFKNCNLKYRTVGHVFDDSFEIRGITTPAYYRLLIPELIPEYDKVVYADADIIFRMDLSGLYSLDLADNYIAATLDLGMNFGEDGKKYIDSLSELVQGKYLQSGFIMLNSKLIRETRLVDTFKYLAQKKYRYQDQDILNIACQGRVQYLPPCFNMTDYSFYYAIRKRNIFLKHYSDGDLQKALQNGTLHYNGHKPWKKYSVNYDIWWEYYRKSPFYDEKFYFDYYYNKLNELDQLSLWKRIKILLRYFFVR